MASEQTSNLGLNIWTDDDYVKRGDFNDNFEKIDDAVGYTQKVIKSIDNANADTPLYIPCYDGSIQAIHPKVLYFPNKFNGYYFWMAYTPYPNGTTGYENPSIAVSQDGFLWMTPNGLTNPITPKPEGNEKVYLSDTHLVYNGTKLELWYRFADENNMVTKIC
ncbi:MAG: hypothetical protein IRZ03_15000, partial [Acidobacterium ailaaui]|nr:hypothetical protein [Pseudacidobacterium ailaaui]